MRPGVDVASEAPRDGRVLVMRKKFALAGLSACGELGIMLPLRRAGYLRQRESAVLRRLSSPHGRLVADSPLWGEIAYYLGLRGRYLSVRELAGVIGWPIGDAELPGLSLGSARRLPPAADIPQQGRVIGVSDYVGLNRPVALPPAAATRHTYLLGPTGTGRPSSCFDLIVQDMAAGRGLAVVDTNGDLAKSLLDLVPPDRFEDVVYLDPADSSPVGLNPLLVVPGMSPDLVADQLVELFHRVWQSFWGPRSAQLFHLGLATLARQPEATLVDLPRIFTDAAFRRQAVGRLNDPVGLGAGWAWFESVPERDRLTMLGPVLPDKMLGPDCSTGHARRARSGRAADHAQSCPGGAQDLDRQPVQGHLGWRGFPVVRRADRDRPVASGYAAGQPFGRRASSLHGLPRRAARSTCRACPLRRDAVSGTQIWVGAQPCPPKPGSAHRQEVREGILANSHSKVCFRIEPSDARVMARTSGRHFKEDDLQALGAYEVAAIVGLEDGGTARPVTVTTMPPPEPVDSAEWVSAISRRLYGRPSDEVEAELRARQEPPRPPAAPVGRKRRAS